MQPARPFVVARASSAFSSLAVTVALAALTILALAIATVQDSKAESGSGNVPGASSPQPQSLHQDFR